MQGTWQVTEYYDDGKAKSADIIRKYKITITQDTITLKDGQTVRYELKHTLDLTKQPKWIDLHHLSGGKKGATSLGIYELRGMTSSSASRSMGATSGPPRSSPSPIHRMTF
jgi:uncharacterized protein (TIGR03067 family)